MSTDLDLLYEEAMSALAEEDLDDAIETMGQMVAEAPDDPRTLEVQGDVARVRDDVDQAEQFYRRLLQDDDPYWQGAGHFNLATLFGSIGNFDPVAHHFKEAINFYMASGDPVRAADVHASLGIFLQNQGDFRGTIESLVASRRLLLEAIEAEESEVADDDEDGFPMSELPDQLATVCELLGVAYRMAGELENARTLLRETLERFEELEDPSKCADTLDALGVVEQIQGNYDAAEELHLKSIAVSESIDYQDGLSVNYGNLTMLNIHRKQFDLAADWAKKAFEIDEADGNENGVAHFHLLMGEIECERQNLENAEDHLNKCSSIYEECGDAEDKLCVESKFAFLCRVRGQFDQAMKINEQVLESAENMGFADGVAAVLDEMALISLAQKKPEDARAYWERALGIYRELQSSRMIKEVSEHLSKLSSNPN